MSFIQSRVDKRNSGKRIDGDYFLFLIIELRPKTKTRKS